MKNLIRTTVCRDEIAQMTRAMRVYLDGPRGPTHAALELSRNVVACLISDDGLDASEVLRTMLFHRIKHRWITTCREIQTCVRRGAEAWERAQGRKVAQDEGRRREPRDGRRCAVIIDVGELTAAEVEAMPFRMRSAVLFALGYRIIAGAWRPVCRCAKHQRRVFS